VNALQGVLLAVRFALEIGALVSLGYWGFATGGNLVVELVLGLGVPLLAAVLWGLFVSPKAKYGSPITRGFFEFVVFGAAVAALLAVDLVWLGISFAAVGVVDSVLVRVLDT
jgi:Protein of unknown function (DUF2568)